MGARIRAWIASHGRVFAVAFLAVSVLGLACAVWLSSTSPGEGIRASDYVWFVPLLAFAATGALITFFRPTHTVGWVLSWLGLLSFLTFLLYGYSESRFVSDPATESWLTVAGDALNTGAIALLAPLVLLLFPDGELPSRRWRWVLFMSPVVAATGALAALFVGGWGGDIEQAVHVSPLNEDLGGVGTVLAGVFLLGLMTLFAVGAAALVIRFRRSTDETRQQVKWLALAALVLLPLVGVEAASDAAGLEIGGIALSAVLAATALTLLPAAVAVAVLRHRLYDIDVVISKTVVFAVLAVFITGIYIAIVVGVGALLGRGDEPSLALSIAATALVAVAFEPVRARVQHWANRLVFGRRATPYEVLSGLTGQLAEVDSSGEALDHLARLLADGTGAQHTAVWLRVGDRLRRAAVARGVAPQPDATGRTAAAETTYALRPTNRGDLPDLPGQLTVSVQHGGILLGALSITKAENDAVTPADAKLVRDAAAGTALLLRNMRLNAELAERAEQLRASRRRLVAEQDGARRKLERDLHDGAQQEVVALKIKLGLAKTVAQRSGADGLIDTIDGLSNEADRTVDAMRTIARGIYPPLLEAEGLPAAVRAATDRAEVPVTLRTSGIGRYDQPIEATVYFCVLEAARNAVKHAAPTRLEIELDDTGTHLQFTVLDDGTGFDPDTTSTGTGLTHMHDRIEALGGCLRIDSRIDQGTTVSGRLPIARKTAVTPESLEMAP